MSRHKQLKELVLSQALDYKAALPDDVWVEDIHVRARIEVSGIWIRDLIAVLTKEHKKNV